MKPFLLLIVIVVLGCSKQPPEPAQLRADENALVEATVTDPARARDLLALLEERDRLVDETGEMLRQYRREMRAINADYDASREILVEMIDAYNRDRARRQLDFIDLIARMKAVSRAPEWRVIAEFQLENFNHRQLVFGRATGGI